jgi:hypothetical protein
MRCGVGPLRFGLRKFLGTPYEISGGRNLTYEWQDLFFEATSVKAMTMLVEIPAGLPNAQPRLVY